MLIFSFRLRYVISTRQVVYFLLPVIIHSSFPYKRSFEWDTDGLLKLKELMPGGAVLQMSLSFFVFFFPLIGALSRPYTKKSLNLEDFKRPCVVTPTKGLPFYEKGKTCKLTSNFILFYAVFS